VKLRKEKRYRHPDIDVRLRSTRTRQEAGILEKLHRLGFPSPELRAMDDRAAEIRMELLCGEKVRDLLDGSCDWNPLAEQLGALVAQLHQNDIIHGDLTTSNMLLIGKRLHLIDFGLGYYSAKAEDKAVDLHLLRRALTSRHPALAEDFFGAAISAYRKARLEQSGPVLERLALVERRGRYQKGS